MDKVFIQTAQNVTIEMEAAGLGDRVIAALLDYLIIFSIYFAAFLLFVATESLVSILMIAIPLFLYFPLSNIFMNGQSIGKRMRQIKVVRIDGNQPGIADYLIRWLFRLIEVEMTAGALAMISLFIRGQGQRIGDMAAKTTVVRVRPQTGLAQTGFTEINPIHNLTYPEVYLLNETEIDLIKEVLLLVQQPYESIDSLDAAMNLKNKLLRKMNRQSDEPAQAVLETLLRDYNHLRSGKA